MGALRDFWYYDGHAGEGLVWIERVLESADEASPALRAKALNTAGWLSFVQGNYEHGKLFNREALAIYRDLGDQANIAWALLFLSSQYLGSPSEVKEGIAIVEEALTLFRALDDKAGIIRALNHLGELVRLDGDYESAKKAYEECLALCREFGDKQREAYQLGNLGLVAQHLGNFEQAESMVKQGLVLCKELNAKYPIPVFIAILSGPVATSGDPERAARLLGASDALFKTMGLGLQPPDQPVIDNYKTSMREQLGEKAFKAAWEKGQAMSLQQAIAFALEEEPE